MSQVLDEIGINLTGQVGGVWWCAGVPACVWLCVWQPGLAVAQLPA